MCKTCVDCGAQIIRAGPVGRNPKRCRQCRNEKRREAGRARIAAIHSLICRQCSKNYMADRKGQKYCSTACMHLGQRNRVTLECSSKQCGKSFQVSASGYAKGVRCCSRRCRAQRMRQERNPCQNPACRKPVERNNGSRKKQLGQDYGKYCCHKCYCDHRWPSRSGSGWLPDARKKMAASALRTSLRRKCKILGIPHDPDCTRLAVCERDRWECQACGIKCNREYVIDRVTRRVNRKNAEHDHIIPTTTLGSPGNVFPNSQCLCRKCNNKKRARSSGQLRLDLEGSVKRWESGGRGRRQQNLKSCVGIQATGQSTQASLSLPLTAL